MVILTLTRSRGFSFTKEEQGGSALDPASPGAAAVGLLLVVLQLAGAASPTRLGASPACVAAGYFVQYHHHHHHRVSQEGQAPLPSQVQLEQGQERQLAKSSLTSMLQEQGLWPPAVTPRTSKSSSTASCSLSLKCSYSYERTIHYRVVVVVAVAVSSFG